MDDDKPINQPEDHSDQSRNDGAMQKQLQEVLTRMDYMERVLRDQLARIYQIELRLGVTPDLTHSLQKPQRSPERYQPPAPMPTVEQPPRPASQGATPVQPPRPQQPFSPPVAPPVRPQGANQWQTARPAQPPFGKYAPQPEAHKKTGELEARIGGSWLQIIGLIAITFAVAFFLKYAFDKGWITPLYRVLTGAVIGVGFLAMGERLRKKYAGYAYGLTGGGILILYLTAWASFRLYNLFPQPVVFATMAFITIAASVLAARYNALLIAVLGLIGGFLTPILLSTGVDNEVGLFSYIALLDAGVLALAFTKQWRSLNYMAFAATGLLVLAWMNEWYDASKLWPTLFFLTLFFMIFALLAILYNVINHHPTRWLDLAMVFTNALAYFGLSYALLNESAHRNKYHAYLGGFAVLMSLFYGGLGYFTNKRDHEDRLLIYTFAGLAVLFLVLAVPIQFDQQWVTMAWAIEGAIMTWVGLRVKDKTSLYAALILFVIAAFHWIVIDVPDFAYQADKVFRPLWNPRALSAAVLIAALIASVQFFKRLGEHIAEDERSLFHDLYVLGANLFAITLLSLDASSYFEQKKALATLATDVISDNWRILDDTKQLTLAVLWSFYGMVALFVGVKRNVKVIRYAALLLLLSITTIKILRDATIYYDANWHTLLVNQTFASFALVILTLAIGAWLYSNSQAIDESERRLVIPLLVIAANVLAVIALSVEAFGYFERIIASPDFDSESWRDYRLMQQLSLSVIWTIYSGVLLTIGILKRQVLLRMMALILLSLTILKVFFVDLAALDKIYRIISFTVLGVILLAVSFLYQRFRFLFFDEKKEAEKDAATPIKEV
ncbi:MAG: DUF2339 domain-containing protein [Acidobacteriota bacterium]